MRRFLLPLILLITASFCLAAEENQRLPLASFFTDHLGWEFSHAIENYGNPVNIFVKRGESADLDTVVFYYSEHLYLYWFHNRVWQIRADERWEGEIDAVRMGMTRKEIERLWGSPINSRDENPTWTLPRRSHPSRIQLYFDGQNRLIDLYVYRSDW